MDLKSKRLEFADALKGFAIFLVIWGHVIQHFGGNTAGSNFFFGLIYSFHMPLFFIISGFFFQSSLKLKFTDFLHKKGMQLLYPWFLWCILSGIYHFIVYRVYNYGTMSIFLLVFNRYFWFLRQLFASYLIAYIGYKFFKKGFWAALACICFVIIFPFFKLQSFYLPFFLFGIFMKLHYQFIVNHLNKFIITSLIVFGVCLIFWENDYIQIFPALFSQKTFSYVLPDIPLSLYRWVIGLSGSLFFFTLFMKISTNNKIFSYLVIKGKYTLAIYILQVLILEIILARFFSLPNHNQWVFILLISIPLSVVLLEFCYRLALGIGKYKKLEKFLFGNAF